MGLKVKGAALDLLGAVLRRNEKLRVGVIKGGITPGCK